MRKEIEQNELNELEYSKAPSMISSYTQEHVFFYLHAQTNINTNKAGYTATPVACGWAGAVFEVT